MALATYSDLVAALGNWLGRDDLTARIPEFIAMAEAEFNRKLRTIEMESAATLTITNGTANLPSRFNGVRSITVSGTVLEFIPPSDAFEITNTGTPRLYTIVDGQFVFRPSCSGTATVKYYQAIPALTASSTTNWLMNKHPDLYLFATLAQAEFYGWNDSRLPLVKARTEEIMEQIAAAVVKERYGGRRLVARSVYGDALPAASSGSASISADETPAGPSLQFNAVSNSQYLPLLAA